jgi:hypothetical protein
MVTPLVLLKTFYMNIKKGINRISVVLALITMLFGFYFGSDIYWKKNTTRIKVFTDNFRSYIKEKYLVEINKEVTYDFVHEISDDLMRSILLDAGLDLSNFHYNPFEKAKKTQELLKAGISQKLIDKYFDNNPMTRYDLDCKLEHRNHDIGWTFEWIYPPVQKVLAVGLLSAISSFLGTLFGIRWISRLIIWIIKGFKD